MKKTMEYFLREKENDSKISMLTAYDYPTARIIDGNGIDCILVGDSLGTNMLGYESEKDVTMDDMIHHLKAVKRGVNEAYIIGDMPYMSYDNIGIAISNARRFIRNGADGVKIEGMQAEIIKGLISNDIEIIGHIGLNPQFHSEKRVKGKSIEAARKLIGDAKELEKLGCKMIVLELIPEELARIITNSLSIPTIGIGAGMYCDGQVLVINDLVGISEKTFRHVNKLADIHGIMGNAVRTYVGEVTENSYIKQGNSAKLDEKVLEELINEGF